MEWDTLRFEQNARVGFLILDRPASLNAVNEQLIVDLEEACRAIQAAPDLRVVVLKGEGRAFCSGMDLRAAVNRPATAETLRAVWAPWVRALEIFERLDQLTIASIHGACLGAGLELALACDFRIAAHTAFFALPQVLYGAPPDAAPSYRLAQMIGLAKAKEIIILGERFTASQAERWGLLTRVVEAEKLDAETAKLAARCLEVGGRAAAVAKRLLRESWKLDDQALAAAIDRARVEALEAEDFRESMRRYREQRQPRV